MRPAGDVSAADYSQQEGQLPQQPSSQQPAGQQSVQHVGHWSQQAVPQQPTAFGAAERENPLNAMIPTMTVFNKVFMA